MLGLKENVLIGKLIPAGTGMKRYRDVEVERVCADPLLELEAQRIIAPAKEEPVDEEIEDEDEDFVHENEDFVNVEDIEVYDDEDEE